MSSNLDRYNYSNYIKEPASEKLTLVHIQPRIRLVTWSLYAGSIYRRSVPYFVTNLRENNNDLIQVNSIPEVDGPKKWFFDIDGKALYYWTTSGSDPVNYTVFATIKMFFSNGPINLPYDLDEGREVEYDPRLRSISKFKTELDDENLGIAIEGSGRCSLVNTDRFFDDKFETFTWENAETTIYSFNRFLKPNQAKILFSGQVKEKKFSEGTVEFQLKDFLEKLTETVPLPLFTEDDGDVSDSLIGKPKRRVYGRVAGLKVKPIDNILDGFKLSGKYSIEGGTKRVFGNENSEIIDEVTPEDKVIINGLEIKVAYVDQKFFDLAEPINQTLSNVDIVLKPEIPYRRRNRLYNIAHHALRQPETFVTLAISENRFYIDDKTDLEPEDIIFIGSEYRRIRRLVGNLVVLWTNLTTVPVPFTQVIKRPVYNAYFNKNEIGLADYSVENSAAGSFLRISEDAEKNQAREKPMSGILTFREGSRIVNTAKTLLSGQSVFTENSDEVKAKATALTGALNFVNGSKIVNAGAVDIEGELQFTNGTTRVTTKRNAISGNLRFTKDSKEVVSDVGSLVGKPLFQNGNAIVENLGTQITGEATFVNNSVKVKTRQSAITGRIQFRQGSNIIEAYNNDISGELDFVNGSNIIKMHVDIAYGTTITFTQGSNDIYGVNTAFTDVFEDDDYIRVPGELKKYKIKTVHSDTYIELYGQFDEPTVVKSTAERMKGSYLTNFIEETAVGDYIRPKDGEEYFTLLSGTLTFTESSDIVDGSGTQFASEISADDYIRPAGTSKKYRVNEVLSNIQLRLSSVFEEATVSSANCEIIKESYIGSYHQHEIAEIINEETIRLTSNYSDPSVRGEAVRTDKTSFISEIGVGDYIRTEDMNEFYKVVQIWFDWKLRIEVNYPGEDSDGPGYFTRPFYLTRFLAEMSPGQFIRPKNSGTWYKISEVISEYELNLESVFAEATTNDFVLLTSYPSYFTSILSPGYFIRALNEDWYEVETVHNDSKITLTQAYLGTTETKFGEYVNTPAQFLTEITAGSFIRPDGSSYDWYEVKRVETNEKLILLNAFKYTIQGAGQVTTTPTYFKNSKSEDRLEAGDQIKPATGANYFIIDNILNDSELDLTINYSDPTASGPAKKLTTPTLFLSEVSVNQWLKGNYEGAKFYQVQSVISDTQLQLYEQFSEPSTTIVSAVIADEPTRYLEELSPGDTIQLENGAEWCEILEIYDNGLLYLVNQYVRPTEFGVIYRITPGNFTSEIRPRDFIRSQSYSTFYEVLQVVNNFRLILREEFRDTGIIETAFVKNVEYIEDDSDITIETMGKTFDGEPTGEFIKTPSDVIKDLLIEAGLEAKLNSQSFIDSKNEAPYLMSLALPLEYSGDAPKLKDVVNTINESVFGSVYNDTDFKINFSVISSKKPAVFTVITETDILSGNVATNGKFLIREAIVQFRFRDIDIFGGGSPFNVASKVSDLITNLGITTKTKTISSYIYNTEDARTIAQRLAFNNEVAKCLFNIEGKLNLSQFSLHDVLVVELDRMFLRYGSTSSRSKIGMVISIEKDGNGSNLVIDDIYNSFNRVGNIAADTSEEFSLADDREKMLNGYITDDNGMINNSEETFGINRIG